MKIFWKIGLLSLASVLLTLASCSHENMSFPDSQLPLSGEKAMTVIVHTCAFDDSSGTEGSNCTKSAYDKDQDKISGINVLIYDADGGKLIRENSGYYSLEELRVLPLPDDRLLNICFFANVPDLSASFPSDEAGLEDFGYCMQSYEEFALRGFPMAYYQLVDTRNEEIINVWFKRLVTRLELSFDKSALNNLHQEGTFLKSLRVCNAALDVYPFAQNGSKATRTTGDASITDIATSADVETLNDGGTAFLYVLTNMQGELLPPDTPQSEKIPQTLEDIVPPGQMGLLTYIEARCEIDSEAWSGEDVVLRHYIGGDSAENFNCSFNIFPGRTRRLGLVLTEDDPLLQPWRFEAEDICFKKFVLDAKEIAVMKNFPSDLTVSAPFDFDIEPCGGHFSATIVGSNFDASTGTWEKLIRIQTDEPLSGLLSPGAKAAPILENLRLKSRTRTQRDTSIAVQIYHEVFPLTFRVDDHGILSIYGDNPLKLNFRCDCSVSDSYGNTQSSARFCLCTPTPYGAPPVQYGTEIADIGYTNGEAIMLSLTFTPLWDGNTGFFMGEHNSALFGPGRKYSPGKLDATKMIVYSTPTIFVPKIEDFSSNLDFHLTLSYTSCDDEKAPKIFFLPSVTEGDPALNTTCGFSWGVPDYRFRIGDFMPSMSTGHNNCSHYRLTDFESCPFYIANGCMQGTHIALYTHSWNSTNKLEEIKVKFYGPGRDLMTGVGDDALEADLLLRIAVKRQNSVVSPYIEAASYDFSSIHLIINGCTCWPGGSPAQRGVLDIVP